MGMIVRFTSVVGVIDITPDEITIFYQISQLDRLETQKWCSNVGIREEEYLEAKKDTLEYSLQAFYFYLFKLLSLKEFQRSVIIFWIGIILICVFVK